MEHLLLEVAAAPLRLIAAKNEKSRSELGRFLAKQVRARARGDARPPPAGARGPAPPRAASRGETSGVLSLWPPPQGWPVAEASARPSRSEGAFVFHLGEAPPCFLHGLSPRSALSRVWQTWLRKERCWVFFL